MKTILLILFSLLFLLASPAYSFNSTQSIAPSQETAKAFSVTPSNPTITVVQGLNAADLKFTITGGSWTSYDTCLGFDMSATSGTNGTVLAEFHVQNFAVGSYPCNIRFTSAGRVKIVTVTIKIKPRPTPSPTPRPAATPRPTATPHTPTPTPVQQRPVLLKWAFANDPCCTTTGFVIYYGTGDYHAVHTELGPKNVPVIYETILPNLVIGTRHYFIVDAKLSDGEERFSTVFICTVTSTGCSP